MSEPHIHWHGVVSGKYGYFIHPIGTAFEDKPGNYIYAEETSTNRWTPVYIGQTSSLKERLADHDKEACAKKNGATHVHAHINSGGEAVRLAEESDLIRRWEPVCNG